MISAIHSLPLYHRNKPMEDYTMKTEKITITKTPLTEIIVRRECAQKDIDALTAVGDSITEYGRETLRDARWTVLIMNDYIKTMKEYGRDYIYLKDGGGVLKYEIGDLLFA